MGHLIKIANLVVDLVEKCSLRPILAKQLPPEVLAVWEEFVSCTLSEINKTHNIALVCHHGFLTLNIMKQCFFFVFFVECTFLERYN